MANIKTSVSESTMSPGNLVGYQEIDLHIISDIKLGKSFISKSRLVAGENKTNSLSSLHTV